MATLGYEVKMKTKMIGVVLAGALLVNGVQVVACGAPGRAMAGPSSGASSGSGGASAGCCAAPVEITVTCAATMAANPPEAAAPATMAIQAYTTLTPTEISQRVTAYAAYSPAHQMTAGGHAVVGTQVPVWVSQDGYAVVDCERLSDTDSYFAAVTFSIR